MKTIFRLITITLVTLSFNNSYCQDILSQTVRGKIIDVDTKKPIYGATIVVKNSDPFLGASTDFDGNFKLSQVKVGRVTLLVSYIGYENKVLKDLIVNSGKELVLNIELQESVTKIKEVTITGSKEKGEIQNDMSLVSGRSISLEETRKYAGGFDDPSRILSNFAGVTNTQNAENDIIVRGNSPKYIQWRLEGMEITNPTHFADQNGAKGGISALNNNLLATSDFYTGAFSPEYGNVLSGVYDVKLRPGNNEKFEASAGIGLLGTEITLEGPFKKGYNGSYLINYRYSVISLVDQIGLVAIDGVLNYQDATFKLMLPTKKAGIFSAFGIMGLSGFDINDVQPNIQNTPGEGNGDSLFSEDFTKKAFLFNSGINHTISLGKKSYLKSSISYSNNGINEEIFETQTTKLFNSSNVFLRDSVGNRILDDKNQLRRSSYRFSSTYNNKINAKNKIQVGIKYALFDYKNEQNLLRANKIDRYSIVDFQEQISTMRTFVSWKNRVNEDLTFVYGIHNMNVLYNGKSTIEPRVAAKWQINKKNTLTAGYGKHSSMESVHNYFAKVEQTDGSVLETNKDLDLLKSHHFVMGYDRKLTKNINAKVELYYQHLYDIPIENNTNSFYSTLNEGNNFRYLDLVNKGTGKNYGIELTLERFLNNNYYFLVNGSLYESKYTAMDGIERNTLYNGNYLINVLFGKEFPKLGKKENQTLNINVKFFYGGGQKHIPLLRDANGDLAVDAASGEFYDYAKAYESKLDDILQLDLAVSYKFNRKKSTHEIFLNLINLTNNQGRISEYYDESEPESIGYIKQFGMFPNLMYRVYF